MEKNALLLQIVKNSGGSAEVVLEKVSRLKGNKGFDAKTLEFVDMLESGIIDPLKVVRCALENSVSVACSLLSVGCSMVEDDIKQSENWDVVSTQ